MPGPDALNDNGDANPQMPFSELRDLSSEVVNLFYTQTFQPGTIETAEDVCAAFSEILARHWNLSCVSIFLSGNDGRLHRTATQDGEELDAGLVGAISEFLVREVESQGTEIQIWVHENRSADSERMEVLYAALRAARVKACVAVPIRVRGMLVGTVVVVSAFADRLQAALGGVRFIAAPMVIAVGNVRRASDMLEQHKRIEQLVEELRQHGQALEEANRELRRVAQYRSMFLARMSHELRTPLTSILGFAEILLDHEDLSEPQRRFCGKIQSSGLQLQSSLDQLVDLSRLEAGQSELFLHEFSVREAVRESCAAVNRLAEKRGVSVVCELPDIPSVVSDEGKFRQVLYNFLAHAISRSQTAEVVKVTARSSPANHFAVSIEDAGEAIHDVSKLFEGADTRVPSDKTASMNEIGIVIARRLIDVLGGTVNLENIEPQGLRVKIELPTRPTG
jgi:signal transduction histidine kinase